MKPDLKAIEPSATRELDITKFFKDKSKKITITLRRWIKKEQFEITKALMAGQVFNSAEETVIIKDADALLEYAHKEVLYGVKDDDWTLEYVRELSELNIDMYEYIHNAILELNRPLPEKKSEKFNMQFG